MNRLAFTVLWLFVFSIPWEKSFNVQGIGTVARALGLAAFGFALLAALRSGKLRRPGSALILMTLFVLWSAMTFYWSVSPELTEERISTNLQLLGFVWVCWLVTEDRIDQLLEAYVLGTLVAALDTFLQFFALRQVYYNRYAGSNFDPNDLALTLAISIPLANYLAINSQGVRHWGYRIQQVIVTIAVFLTGSRAGTVACILAWTCVPLTISHLRMRQKLALGVVSGILISGSLIFVPQTSSQRIMSTGSELMGGTLNSRVDIWKAGWDVFLSHAIGGVGAGAYPAAIEPELGVRPHMTFVAHSTPLSILFETGPIGLGLFLILLTKMFIAIRRLRDRPLRTTWTIAFLAWGTGALTLTWENRKPTWFLLAAAVLAVNYIKPQPSRPGVHPAPRTIEMTDMFISSAR